MNRIIQYIFCFALLLMISCEEAFTPEIDESSREIIVEGHIEKGMEALPPYVLLSRSLPFFGNIHPDDLADNQINDAEVYVAYNNNEYMLNHVCLSNLPPELREELISEIGIIPDMTGRDFCVYIDFSQEIPLEFNGQYDLKIILSNGDTLKSTTTIPEHVPIDSFRFRPPPGQNPNDSLARLLCRINDPAGMENFYRYLTAEQGEGFTAGFGSVTDDAFFDGQSFEFPLQKAEDTQSSDDTDANEFGLYTRGDTIRIKWMNLDRAHYDFWNTFEFNLNSQGPFSSYTRVSSNVSGALGIWGAYSSTIYTLEVPEN